MLFSVLSLLISVTFYYTISKWSVILWRLDPWEPAILYISGYRQHSVLVTKTIEYKGSSKRRRSNMESHVFFPITREHSLDSRCGGGGLWRVRQPVPPLPPPAPSVVLVSLPCLLHSAFCLWSLAFTLLSQFQGLGAGLCPDSRCFSFDVTWTVL